MLPYGPYHFTATRTFDKPIYDDHHGVINYTMTHHYKLDPEQSDSYNNQNFTHINFDGQSIWYQMNANRPTFWKAWQAMALASSTMKESRMLSTLYAYNAYYYFFNDTAQVYAGALAGFKASDRVDIYYDSKYGMDSVKKLITWVTAADGNFTQNAQMEANADLKNHFKKKNMTDEKLLQIVGPKSMLAQII